MIETHFEIGHNKICRCDDITETEFVFSSNSLSECIEEFKIRKYNTTDYFIDVWEQKDDDVPYPKADIKLEDWIFNT